MFIAEIGINHNGEIETAKRLIQIAKNVGADIVKFQKRNPELCVPDFQKYIIKDTIFGKMEYIKYKHLIEFGKKEYDEIARYCKQVDILWTASVWDIDSLYFINNYTVPFIKIPSACITNSNLITETLKVNREVIISTGMSSEEEIDNAVTLLNKKLIGILHCNSTYPSSISELNLNYLKILLRKYPLYQIGYSGHEEGFLPTLIAKALGASIIERHITLDKNMLGTDQKSSLNPEELYILIEQLKDIEAMLGKEEKIISESELIIKEKLRPV